MKTYELVIAERQPTCGGKSPVKSRIMTVQTDDPEAYVRGIDPDAVLETHVAEDGAIIVETDHNGMWVKYEFSEE